MILDQYGKPLAPRRQLRQVHARYDAAQTVLRNETHWAQADYLSPNASNSEAVRRKLRARSRYEAIENNGFLKGMILSMANDMVMSGPKMQLSDERLTPERANLIEKRFASWARATRLREKLWQLRIDRCVAGEGFAVLANNPRAEHPIPLDLRLVEADQVTTPTLGFSAIQENEVDGVRFDEFGNATQYHVLRQHPGSNLLGAFTGEGAWLPASIVVHWFRRDRNWNRGIPETTPSLPLCAMLRRFTLAVCTAAETAANFSAVLESEGPPSTTSWTDDSGDLVEDPVPLETFAMERGMMTVLPWRNKLTQLKAEQPNSLYTDYVQSLLLEIARPLLIPHNRAISSSKDSNMASAVVDEQVYRQAIGLDRKSCEEQVLHRILAAWWFEGVRTPGYFDEALPGSLNDFSQALLENPSLRDEVPDICWRWDLAGVEHTDPMKVENAWQTAFTNGWVTDRDIQEIRYNRDVNEWARDVEEMLERRRQLGLPLPGEKAGAAMADDDDDE